MVTSVFRLSIVQLQQLIRTRSVNTVQVVFSRPVELRMKQRFVAGREIGVVVALNDDDPTVLVVTASIIGG